MNELNPYAPPESPSAGIVETIPAGEYGGIGRLAFLGYYAAIYLVWGVFAFAFAMLVSDPGGPLTRGDQLLVAASYVVAIAMMLAWLYVASRRLKNAGYHYRWTCALLIPIMNAYFLLVCFGAPEGYAKHKRLDRAGKVVFGLAIAALIGLLGLFVVFG